MKERKFKIEGIAFAIFMVIGLSMTSKPVYLAELAKYTDLIFWMIAFSWYAIKGVIYAFPKLIEKEETNSRI